MSPYTKVILNGMLAGLSSAAILALVFWAGGGADAYKTPGAFIGVAFFCTLTSTIYTAKVAFALGQETAADSTIAK